APARDTLHPFPTRRSSDLACGGDHACVPNAVPAGRSGSEPERGSQLRGRWLSRAGAGDLADLVRGERPAGGERSVAGTDDGVSTDRKSTRLNSSHVAISYA